jgi:hypothetical protein
LFTPFHLTVYTHPFYIKSAICIMMLGMTLYTHPFYIKSVICIMMLGMTVLCIVSLKKTLHYIVRNDMNRMTLIQLDTNSKE